MHVHQDADVGASHDVEDLAGDGLGEEGVIRRGDEHAFPGALQQHAALCPPDGDAGHRTFRGQFSGFSNHCQSMVIWWRAKRCISPVSGFISPFGAIKLKFKNPPCRNLRVRLPAGKRNIFSFLLYGFIAQKLTEAYCTSAIRWHFNIHSIGLVPKCLAVLPHRDPPEESQTSD